MRLLFVFFLALSVLIPAGCGKVPSGTGKRPPSKAVVSAVKAVRKDLPEIVEAIGSAEAFDAVEIKSRADGIITGVHFKEGERIAKGRLLFTIDQAPYREKLLESRALVRKAEAGLKRSEADYLKAVAMEQESAANYDKSVTGVSRLKADYEKEEAYRRNAEETEKRYAGLLAGGFIPQEEYDKAKTELEAYSASAKAKSEEIRNADASVRASAASLESAKASRDASRAAIDDARAQLEVYRAQAESSEINLGYCSITSPIDGIAGTVLVKQGNLVKASGEQPLVLINRPDPIYVACSVPERYLSSVRNVINKGKVMAETSDGSRATGRLVFVDNAVDVKTGTVLVKALFKNPDGRLWPGQFIKSEIVIGVAKDAVVVPSTAVQNGQKGDYVFIAGDDGRAKLSYVKAGHDYNGETVVLSGVKEGEMVVTDGFLKLVDGSPLSISK